MANTRLIQQAFDEKHYRRIEKVLGNIHSAYLSAIKEAVTLAGGVNFDPSKPFSFKDYPATKRRVDNMINELAGTVNFEVKKGMKDAWLFSALKNDKTIETALDISKFTKSQQARYFGRNLEALDAFTRRKEGGLNLSDKIWNLTGKFKTELEMGIDSSLLRGESAAVMSRNIRGYLKNPDNLFRRVRNDRGALHLSKRAKELKPGKGVYRSSYKNAMRVTRTEINMSYREADFERWKQLDFVVGIEVRLTNNPGHVVDICDDLKGKYPKEFKFRGWHPQCMCHALAILATPAEREAMTDKILEGESPSDIVSDNAVKDVTAGMKDWIKNNAGRETNSQPYWIKDNFEGGSLSGGLKPSITSKAVVPESQAVLNLRDDLNYYKQKLLENPDRDYLKESILETENELREQIALDKYRSETGAKKLVTYSDTELDYLKDSLGIECNVSGSKFAMEYNRVMSGFDIEEYIRDINKSISAHELKVSSVEITVESRSIKVSVIASPIDPSIGVSSSTKMELDRKFTLESGEIRKVSHSLFALPEPIQGKGLSKEIMADCYKQYRNAGIEEINVHANINVGGYTWGRYGFSITDKAELMEVFGTESFRRRVAKINPAINNQIDEIINNFYLTRPNSTPFPMNLISDIEGIKPAMLWSDWKGHLKLYNIASRKRFEDYLFGR